MIVTRFAPSPTGMLHIGGVRTALFSWLQARRMGGKFILRVEDTDRERSTEEAVRVILEGMHWLGLDPDEGPYFQTKRFDRYREVINQLLAEGKAYRCYCTKEELEQLRADQMARKEKPRYDGRWRNRTDSREGVAPVIRFKNPLEGEVVVEDQVHGRVVFQNSELDDLIIARGDGTPTYNFCVVVDDMDMGVTHVIRGDDHLNNTPRQINMFQALGAKIPVFAHVPMILGADGAKLSKRHGAVSVLQYEEDGFLPDALLNYLVRLGWSHGDQEIFSRAEMFELFKIEDVNAKASRLDPAKLNWINQHYLKTDVPSDVAKHLVWHLQNAGYDLSKGPDPAEVVVALRDRVHTLKEMAEKAKCWFCLLTEADIDAAAAAKQLTAAVREPLGVFTAKLEALPGWTLSGVHEAFAGTLAELNLAMGKVGPAIRVAVTGSTASPSIDHTVYLCGRETALARLHAAIGSLPQ